MEFEENNQTQDASFPEKPNETPAQDMPGAEAEGTGAAGKAV